MYPGSDCLGRDFDLYCIEFKILSGGDLVSSQMILAYQFVIAVATQYKYIVFDVHYTTTSWSQKVL